MNRDGLLRIYGEVLVDARLGKVLKTKTVADAEGNKTKEVKVAVTAAEEEQKEEAADGYRITIMELAPEHAVCMRDVLDRP